MVYVGQGQAVFNRIDEPHPGMMWPKRRKNKKKKKKKKGTSTPPPPPPSLTPAPIDWSDWEELCQAAPPVPAPPVPAPPPEIWEPEDWNAASGSLRTGRVRSPHHGSQRTGMRRLPHPSVSQRIGMQRFLHPNKNSPFQGYGRFYGHPTLFEKTLFMSMQKETLKHQSLNDNT
jgi:hypothetical protein